MSDYMPIEIVEQLLLRLPIISILRFSSTCKTWYNLITSPHFISAHLHYTKSLPYSTHLLIHRYSKDCIVFYSHDEAGTFEEYERFVIPAYSSLVGGCCNGLFCLATNNTFSVQPKNQEVVLWNPMIRRFLHVPKSDVDLDTSMGFHTFGFVFDYIGNDYKILRIQRSSDKDPSMVEVFRLSTGLGEDISCKVPFVNISKISHQADLKGISHWIAVDSNNMFKIFTFDANKEVFGSIELPAIVVRDDEFYRAYRREQKFLFVFEGSLFLIRSLLARDIADEDKCHFDIWRMGEYNVVESWTQVRTWAFDIDVRPVGFRKNGEIHWVNNFGKLISTHLEDPSINYFEICRNEFYKSSIDYVGSLILLDKSLSSGADDQKVKILRE